MVDSLYEIDRIKITYLHSPEPGREKEIVSGEDHELWLKDKDGEWYRYIIPKGVLKELARTMGDNDLLGLINKINNLNFSISDNFSTSKISFTEVGKAFLKAYQKEEEEVEKYLSEQRKK